MCEIDALDAVTGLSGDFDPGAITVNVEAGGTTVWAWTGESGDEVEDGGEGLASINLTETSPLEADAAKVTTDMAEGATRAHFGSTVTVTIQLINGVDSNDAVRDPDGNSYKVTILRASDVDIRTDDTPADVMDDVAASKTTEVLKVDASGKATFTITASDPDPDDSNNPDGADASGDDPAVPDRIDRVRVTYRVEAGTGGYEVDNAVSSTASPTPGDPPTQTITFSDARSVVAGGSVKPAADYLMAPTSGSANNVVTVTVVDQYGDPIRGHLVKLSSNHSTNPPAEEDLSTFPVARTTDSDGSVRIGYTYTGAASVEELDAHTSVTADGNEMLTLIPEATADFYWAAPAAGPTVASGEVLVADLERNTLVIANSEGPQLVTYDDNDQFVVGGVLTGMAAFEEALAADLEEEGFPDLVEVSSYDPTDPGDVARFVLTVSTGP